MALINFPLMLVSLVVYNLFVVTGDINPLEDILFRMEMSSGGMFTLSLGEALIILSLAILFVEILKATRSATSSIVDHLLSMIVFVIFLVEFLLVGRAATATFFILMMMSLIDVAAGYAVSIRNAVRDLSIEN